MSLLPQVSIRDYSDSPEELLQLAVFYHNQFVDVASPHSTMLPGVDNWFSQATLPPRRLHTSTLSSLTTAESTRLHFHKSVISSVIYCQGTIRILFQDDQIIGCAMWYPPYVRFQPPTLKGLCMTGFLKLIWKWGYEGFRRLSTEFEGHVDRMGREAFAAKGRSIEEGLLLVLLAVEEEHRGKGFARKLVEDGAAFHPEAPLLLDTADVGTSQAYKKMGFEVVGETRVGKGQCDDKGFELKSQERRTGDGLPLFVMVKW